MTDILKSKKNFNTNTDNHDEWLTPKYITDALGEFDLDPCSPSERRPWDTAKRHIGLPNDGLAEEWEGRVWCNPPYGRETFKWLNKLATHGSGTALVFARTETKGFHSEIWDRAHSIFFFSKRIKFHKIDGSASNTANAPSCLVSYSAYDTYMIEISSLNGKQVYLRK